MVPNPTTTRPASQPAAVYPFPRRHDMAYARLASMTTRCTVLYVPHKYNATAMRCDSKEKKRKEEEGPKEMSLDQTRALGPTIPTHRQKAPTHTHTHTPPFRQPSIMQGNLGRIGTFVQACTVQSSHFWARRCGTESDPLVRSPGITYQLCSPALVGWMDGWSSAFPFCPSFIPSLFPLLWLVRRARWRMRGGRCSAIKACLLACMHQFACTVLYRPPPPRSGTHHPSGGRLVA